MAEILKHTYQNRVTQKIIGIISALALVLSGTFIPTLPAFAVTPTNKLGNITQNKIADGKEVMLSNGSLVLYVDDDGLLSAKSPNDADFDSKKATFTLKYASTSQGTNRKNQQTGTTDPTILKSADHYNIIAPSGLHLTLGNEDRNSAGNVKFSLHDDEFFNTSNQEYFVNVAGGGLVGWKGYHIYSDRFSTDGIFQWFGINAVNSSSTLLPKGISEATITLPDGSTVGGFEIYEFPDSYTVTYKDDNGTTLQGPDTLFEGDAEPAAPADPTKPEDDDFTYEFDTWDKQVDGEGNVIYTATYKSTPKDKPQTTTIVVRDEDGNTIPGTTVKVVCGDSVIDEYTIEDGDKDKVVEIQSDECQVVVETPEGYVDPDPVPVVVDGDTEVVVNKATHTVTWVNWDDTIIAGPVTVKEGEPTPAHPDDPTRPADEFFGYDFSGWEETVDDDGNIIYKATYVEDSDKRASDVERDGDDDNQGQGSTTVPGKIAQKTEAVKKPTPVVKTPAETGVATFAQTGDTTGVLLLTSLIASMFAALSFTAVRLRKQ